MTLDDRLTNCAVIGAAGKMGRGIVLVLLKEMVATDFLLNRVSSKLICVDHSIDGLSTLLDYLDVQMLKFAEKNISRLRKWYSENPDLIDNGEIINAFLKRCRSMLQTSTSYKPLEKSNLVFEAVFENLNIKNSVYRKLRDICPDRTLFFSNTSSIPISELNFKNDLNGRLIGFHFYNPPAIQKLVEVISTRENNEKDVALSLELIKRMGKLAVPSNDIAGFIGNGHFIREGLFYLNRINHIPCSRPAAIYFINEVVKKLLLRPMGIFQLIDYVGVDVFSMICKTMEQYINEDFNCSLPDVMLERQIKGGQFGDGSQKNGFFHYEKGQITGVYDTEKTVYIGISEITDELSELPVPDVKYEWKSLSRDKLKNDKISSVFKSLIAGKSLACQEALKYLSNSRFIAQNLVKNGVADDICHVNDVMTNGFFHLYGPASELLGIIPEAKHE